MTDVKHDIVVATNASVDLLTPNYNVEEDPTPMIGEGKKYKSLRIKFSLKCSSYATMFMRELTKVSSAFSVQDQMSKEMINKYV